MEDSPTYEFPKDQCALCSESNPDRLVYVENLPMQLCFEHAQKLFTHMAIVCTGCDTCHWLKKTGRNVMWAAEYFSQDPDHVFYNPMLATIPKCKHCDFMNSIQPVGRLHG